jgi:hypothetical protein
MLEKRRYCIWAGKQGTNNESDSFTFKGDETWASHLKAELGDDAVMFFGQQDLILVRNAKKYNFTNHHILAFITSYTRVNMMEMMRSIKGSLIKVVLDGIYFRGEVPETKLPYRLKDHVIHKNFRDAWYYPSTVSTQEWPVYNPDLIGSCVLAGAGGTGKSESILANRSLLNVLYVAPTNLLARKAGGKYKVSATTSHRLLGATEGAFKCQPWKDDHREPANILFDELTMNDEKVILKALEMYPNSVFYIAGDIDEKQWYQCRNGYPGNFSKVWIPQDWRYVRYTTDYRSLCPELAQMKLDIRAEMKRVFSDWNRGADSDAKKVAKFIREHYTTVKFDDAVKMFLPGDYWIAGTHKTNDNLLKAGVVSGYINSENEIVQEFEEKAKKRGSFTTHSFQGWTIEHERVFVSIDDAFEYAMTYTAISRVRRMSQLILVSDK